MDIQAYQGLPGLRGKLYSLERNENEKSINDYNPALLLAWRGNIDLQFVSASYSFIVDYVTSYASKSEKKSSNGNFSFINENMVNILFLEDDFLADIDIKDRKNLFKLALQFVFKRVMGTLEACDRLYGHHLYSCDLNIMFLNTNANESRTRCLKTLKELQANNEDESAFRTNFVDDYYPNRPKVLENFSLFNLFSNFE